MMNLIISLLALGVAVLGFLIGKQSHRNESDDVVVGYKLEQGAFAPQKAHKADAGWDIRTPKSFKLLYDESVTIDTGIHLIIPEGYYGRIASKSGLNVNHDIVTEGVIDSGYTGTIKVKLYNHGNNPHVFYAGDKLTQIIIEKVPDVVMLQTDDLPDSDRGSNGFGSSGR